MNFYEPMLAASLLPSDVVHTDETIYAAMQKLKYPVWATLKKDGVRAIRLDGTLKSRTRKLIPNRIIRERSLVMPGGFDVELWNPSLEFNDISGIVRTEMEIFQGMELSDLDKAASIQFHVLDWFRPPFSYNQRCEFIMQVMADMPPRVQFEMPYQAGNADQLFHYFNEVEQQDGEGICFRTLNSPYKQGRSTLKEQYLVKYSRFIYEEAIIVGFEEQMENGNPEKRNATGRMKRQTNQENMYPKNTLGALVVAQGQILGGTHYYTETFKVATGFNDRQRKEIWLNRNKYLGQQITYKHKPHGRLNKPRSPIFHGFRGKGL